MRSTRALAGHRIFSLSIPTPLTLKRWITAANVNAFKGAGIQAATMVSDKGAEVLMTGYCGPKAFATLEAAGVKVVDDITGKVRDAIKTIKEGKVTYATGANKEAHW